MKKDEKPKISISYKKGDINKPTFVFIHGNAQNSTSGKSLINFFSEKGHAVLSFDMPGHGDSQPDINKKIRMKMLTDILRLILQKYNIDSVIIAGHSMGGMILLDYATKNLNKIHSMILIDTSDVDPVKVNKLIPLSDVITNIIINSKKAFKKQYKYDFTDIRQQTEEEILEQGLKYTDPKSLERNFLATKTYDVRMRLKLIEVPTLILCGEQDSLITKEMTEQMSKEIKDSKLITIQNYGHNWLIQRPDLMQEILKENYDYLK